eukprot:SAG31_NODE_7648_length_1630_cov_2.512084_1_plen_281_part_10
MPDPLSCGCRLLHGHLRWNVSHWSQLSLRDTCWQPHGAVCVMRASRRRSPHRRRTPPPPKALLLLLLLASWLPHGALARRSRICSKRPCGWVRRGTDPTSGCDVDSDEPPPPAPPAPPPAPPRLRYEYIGCKDSGGWERPFGNVPYSSEGAESCLSQCFEAGYTYAGLECPMAGGSQVHCQCANQATVTAPDAYGGVCSRNIAHCNLDSVHDGYNFGGHGIGSVYAVAPPPPPTPQPSPPACPQLPANVLMQPSCSGHEDWYCCGNGALEPENWEECDLGG